MCTNNEICIIKRENRSLKKEQLRHLQVPWIKVTKSAVKLLNTTLNVAFALRNDPSNQAVLFPDNNEPAFRQNTIDVRQASRTNIMCMRGNRAAVKGKTKES